MGEVETFEDFMKGFCKIAIETASVIEEDDGKKFNNDKEMIDGLFEWMSVPKDPGLVKGFL